MRRELWVPTSSRAAMGGCTTNSSCGPHLHVVLLVWALLVAAITNVAAEYRGGDGMLLSGAQAEGVSANFTKSLHQLGSGRGGRAGWCTGPAMQKHDGCWHLAFRWMRSGDMGGWLALSFSISKPKSTDLTCGWARSGPAGCQTRGGAARTRAHGL